MEEVDGDTMVPMVASAPPDQMEGVDGDTMVPMVASAPPDHTHWVGGDIPNRRLLKKLVFLLGLGSSWELFPQ